MAGNNIIIRQKTIKFVKYAGWRIQIIMEQRNNVASYTEDEIFPPATMENTKTLHSATHQKTIKWYGNMNVKNWVE
jgi:hypothetical protein